MLKLALCAQAYGEVDPDGSRYLLGDHTGRLYLLVLVKDQGSVSGLKLEPLGTTSAASTLSCVALCHAPDMSAAARKARQLAYLANLANLVSISLATSNTTKLAASCTSLLMWLPCRAPDYLVVPASRDFESMVAQVSGQRGGVRGLELRRQPADPAVAAAGAGAAGRAAHLPRSAGDVHQPGSHR